MKIFVSFFVLLLFSAHLSACENCVKLVNKIRADRGLPAYIFDEELTRDAIENARYRASIGHHGGHLRRQVPPLSSGEAEGCEGPRTNARSNEFWACGVFSNSLYRQGYRFAGASKARDQFGRVYCTLRLSKRRSVARPPSDARKQF